MSKFQRIHRKFICEGMAIQNIIDLSNVVQGIRVINRGTATMANPSKDLKPMMAQLKKWGYKHRIEGDISYWDRAGAKTITVSPTDEAQTKYTINVL